MGAGIKVLVLAEHFFPSPTPSAQRAYAYTRTLVSHGFETIVITKSRVGFGLPKAMVISIPTRWDLPAFDPFLFCLYLIRSIGVVRRHHINFVISTVPKINNALVGFLISKLFRVPHIVDIRDYWESMFLLHPLNRIIPRRLSSLLPKITSIIYRQSGSVITVNKSLKRILVGLGIPSRKIYLLPNGADTKLFKPCRDEHCLKNLRKKYGLPLSKFIFVYGGTLSLVYKFYEPLKGLGYLSKKNDILFLIVGRPTFLENRQRLVEITRKLKLEKSIKMIDPMPTEKLAELFRCCNVGVIPLDDIETLKPLTTVKVFDYLASGLPVLASGPPKGELENFIKQYGFGYFIEKCTAENFAEGFRKFIQDKKKTRGMGLRGRTIMEKFFDRYALAHKLIEVIQEIVKVCEE